MRTRVYKIYTNASGVTTGPTIGRSGRITGVSLTCNALGAAVLTGGVQGELMLNSTGTSVQVNDPPGNAIAGITVHAGNASSGSNNISAVGLALPVQAGDRLYFGVAAAYGCTTPASFAFSCFVYVDEQ